MLSLFPFGFTHGSLNIALIGMVPQPTPTGVTYGSKPCNKLGNVFPFAHIRNIPLKMGRRVLGIILKNKIMAAFLHV